MLSQYIPTTIETKALCSVLRKAELKGTETLVDTMIEICDTQSGIMLQDLWDGGRSINKRIRALLIGRLKSTMSRITVVC